MFRSVFIGAALSLSSCFLGCGGGEDAAPCDDDPSKKECDGACVGRSPANGCDSDDCTPCPTGDNLSTYCLAGQCATSCLVGWEDCDGDPTNGCETNIHESMAHCGGCGEECPEGTDGVRASCQEGECLRVCDEGFSYWSGDGNDTCVELAHHSGGDESCPEYLETFSADCLSRYEGSACDYSLSDVNCSTRIGCYSDYSGDWIVEADGCGCYVRLGGSLVLRNSGCTGVDNPLD